VFRYARRVHFAETDLAGMVHFSNFFRYMEEAEHALWRAAGMTIDSPTLAKSQASSGAAAPELPAGAKAGSTITELKWPRVAAAFDFKRPLRFEDEFEVQVGIGAVTSRTIQYNHTILRGDVTVGVGTVTAACVQLDADHRLKAVEIPAEILERLRGVGGA
jgi:acyl-CoA thioesterase FadM